MKRAKVKLVQQMREESNRHRYEQIDRLMIDRLTLWIDRQMGMMGLYFIDKIEQY